MSSINDCKTFSSLSTNWDFQRPAKIWQTPDYDTPTRHPYPGYTPSRQVHSQPDRFALLMGTLISYQTQKNTHANIFMGILIFMSFFENYCCLSFFVVYCSQEPLSGVQLLKFYC